MKDPDEVMASFTTALAQLVAKLPPEHRVAGLTPEQRLAGLSDGERVLAMPDAALRALSADYVATLPDDVQRKLRERLGSSD